MRPRRLSIYATANSIKKCIRGMATTRNRSAPHANVGERSKTVATKSSRTQLETSIFLNGAE
jgi:hypothetical protein